MLGNSWQVDPAENCSVDRGCIYCWDMQSDGISVGYEIPPSAREARQGSRGLANGGACCQTCGSAMASLSGGEWRDMPPRCAPPTRPWAQAWLASVVAANR